MSDDSDAMEFTVTGQFEGLPYKGPPITIKDDDPDYLKPQFMRQMHVKQFCTANAESLKEYEDVCQLIVKGLAVVSFEERRFDLRIQAWHILLRWIEVYYGKPVGSPLGTVVGAHDGNK